MDSSRGVRWAPSPADADYQQHSRRRGRERNHSETSQARPILRKAAHDRGDVGTEKPRVSCLEHDGDAILQWSVKQKQLHEEGGIIHNEQDAWRKHGKICRAQMIAKDEQTENSLFVLNEKFKIDWYFKVANKVLSQYLQSGSEAGIDLKETYVIGHRLVKFLCQVLPAHEHYYSDEPHIWELRKNSQEQLVRLLQYLDVLAEQIDEEEYNKFIISDLSGKENEHPDLTSIQYTPTNIAVKSNVHASDPEPFHIGRSTTQMQQLRDPIAPMAGPEHREQQNIMTPPQLRQAQQRTPEQHDDNSLLFSSSLDYSSASSSDIFSNDDFALSTPPPQSLLDSTLRLDDDDASTDILDLSRNLYLTALHDEDNNSEAADDLLESTRKKSHLTALHDDHNSFEVAAEKTMSTRDSDYDHLEASSSWDNSFLEHIGQRNNNIKQGEQQPIQRTQSSQSIKSQASMLVQALVKNSTRLSPDRTSKTPQSNTRDSNYSPRKLSSSDLRRRSDRLLSPLTGTVSPDENQGNISLGIESEIFGDDTVDFSEFYEWKVQQKKFEKAHHVAEKKAIQQKQPYQSQKHQHRDASSNINTRNKKDKIPQEFQLQFEEPRPVHISQFGGVYSSHVDSASPHDPRIWKEEEDVSPKGVWDLKEWQSVDDTCSTDPSSQGSTQQPSAAQQWASWGSSPYDNQGALPGSNHPLFEDDKKAPGFHQLSSEDWEGAFANEIIQKPRGGQLRHFKSCIKCLVE
mmetsp:Transcript_21274/g.32734  ORF Transcript_21274/g.32734 Transcript_21274/m.32734 type:complete len:742 (-) Transcript_21274:45-2270(-)|eukprot:CAMPEP_0195299442 /NCGR_PEP_ID=MMETSP0707-20130614/25568_1 /TAXON_ID=33640 /ORGANISM="Asterionellopsis glacialis, Strain CCMP134" /LENGTH=741 /DNA_ID=CAMNT_0040361855 /DNA_START=177 /DNA_END=2402 /DNA_ORIENTATION=-